MPALSSFAMFFFQGPIHAGGTQPDMLTIFVGIIALFFFLLMVGMLVGVVMLRGIVRDVKAKMESLEKRGEELIAHVSAKATPIVDMTQAIIEDLQPKIRSVSSDVEAISKTVRIKAEEVGATVSQVNLTVQEANGRTRGHIARVDTIVTGALNATHEISEKIQAGIRYPINHVAGWIAGLKTGMETLAARSPWGKKKPGPYDL